VQGVVETMQGVVEIRWHGRCGQGPATAARLAAGSASRQGKYFQAFPAFQDDGPPRSGEPIVAFTRVSDEPIQVRSEVEHPRVIALLDPSLLSGGDVTRGLPDDAIVVVNSDLAPAELREKYGLTSFRLYSVAASTIAAETAGSTYPNTSMLGALSRVTGLFPIESVIDYVREDFGRKFPPEVVEANVSAITRSYEEVRAE
jgi:pyruvate ferredoxin oxidoreductase gamma subunit